MVTTECFNQKITITTFFPLWNHLLGIIALRKKFKRVVLNNTDRMNEQNKQIIKNNFIIKTKLFHNCELPSHVLLDLKLKNEHDNSKNGSSYVCNTHVIMGKGLIPSL